MAFDTANARYSTNSADFCTSIYGCKSWGSNITTLDTNGNQVTQMPQEVHGSLKNLPDIEATLNTYLNNGFYNGLSDDVKSLIVEKAWNVGPTAINQTNLSESIKEEGAYKWKGKVALMNVTDYVKASTNSACSSVKNYSYNGTSSCYNNSATHNYLYSNNHSWTVSTFSVSGASNVFYVSSNGQLSTTPVDNGNGIRPAFYLSSEISLSGEGSETDPYTIPKPSQETPKDEENNNVTENNENETNNKIKADDIKVVGVPSTSLDAKKGNKVQTVKNANVLETKNTPTFGLMIIGITFISGLAFISNKLLKSKA